VVVRNRIRDQPQFPIAYGNRRIRLTPVCKIVEEEQGLNRHIPSISEDWLMRSRGFDARCVLCGG
jgi:hypothetical protein